MSSSFSRALLVSLAITLLSAVFLRLLYILPSTNPRNPKPHRRGGPTRLLIVLGSGGHTAEMIAMLKNLDSTLYNHRSYVVSAGDKFSAIKARDFEENLQKKGKGNTNLEEASKNILGQYGSYDIVMVPRARKIHQSLLTTPFSALQCLFACISVVRGPSVSGTGLTFPDLILTNGPGTGVCVIAAAYLLRILGLCGSDGGMRSIYVESWARVSSLSLSGKILIMFVDRFFVQWEKLKGIGGRAEYIGVLV